MATLVWQRDIASDIGSAKTTFSSWDGCMSKVYCKWPVIAAIVVGSLIVLSVLWCIGRCLCCGAECCCGCLSCCNRCCPSPRRKNAGYQISPPQQYQSHPTYNQYQPPPQAPVYASGGLGHRGPQTATFDAPSRKFNEDALPAMPSWDNASSRRVEEDDVELEKLDHPQAQQQSLLSKQDPDDRFYGDVHRNESYGHGNPDAPYGNGHPTALYNNRHNDPSRTGDIGTMSATSYHGDNQYQQQSYSSPYANQHETAYQSPYQSHAPVSPSAYSSAQSYGRGYEPSVPPSYRTRQEEHIVSPIVSPQPQHSYPRRGPAPGNWNQF